jgi:hypothetical protein
MAELEFRDGKRETPDYLADYLSYVDTVRVTYLEAIELANKARLTEHLNNMQQKVITEHFKDLRSL